METSNYNESNADNVDDADPVETMLKKTGCLEQHYNVQECIARTKDWRQCQEVVATFKACMTKYTESKKRTT